MNNFMNFQLQNYRNFNILHKSLNLGVYKKN